MGKESVSSGSNSSSDHEELDNDERVEDKEDLILEELHPITSYKRKWFILLVIIGANVLIGFNSVCFGQMNTEYSLFFNVTPATVDWLTLGSATGEMITCLVIAVLTLWKLVRLRWWYILITVSSTLAYVFILASIWLGAPVGVAILGQVFMGFSSGILESVMPLVVAVWFPEHQLATSLGAIWVGEVIGFAFGSIVPGKVVTEEDYMNLEQGDRTSTKNTLSILFGVTLAISFVLFILSVFFMEDKPPNPPSISAAKRFYHVEHIEKCNCKAIKNNLSDFANFIKSVFTNFSTIGLTITFAIAYTLTTLQFMFMSDLIKSTQSGQVETEAQQLTVSSYIMLSLCIGCVFGGLIGGWVLDKLKKYKLLFIISSLGTLVSSAPLIAGKLTSIYSLIYVGNIIQGFLIMALLTIVNDSALQHMFPAEEMATGTWLVFSGNLATSLIPIAARALLDSFKDVGFFIYYDCCILVCAIFACSVTINHRRLDLNDELSEDTKLCKK